MSEPELRAMVREVLREALGKTKQPGIASQTAPAATERVRLANDSDIARFVGRIVMLLDDPATAASLRSGSLRFSLEGGTARPTASPAAAHAAGDVELAGTITEAAINKAAANSRIMLAPDAVITPLARDRARALGLKIERRR